MDTDKHHCDHWVSTHTIHEHIQLRSIVLWEHVLIHYLKIIPAQLFQYDKCTHIRDMHTKTYDYFIPKEVVDQTW